MSEGVALSKVVVVVGMGAYLVGRKDLPKVFHFVGTQFGRVVGLLQGARARADRFAVDNEMRALQQELRSGLRELDAVKGELVLATSGGVLFGKGLSSNITRSRPTTTSVSNSSTSSSHHTFPSTLTTIGTTEAAATNNTTATPHHHHHPPPTTTRMLAPRSQSVAAVAEEEWEKRGIGFKSRAEMGRDDGGGGDDFSSSPRGGSFLLADILKQTLIHDQYDRVVQEQDDILQSRAAQIQRNKNHPEESK